MLSGVAQALAQAGDRDGALQAARQALQAAGNIQDEGDKAEALRGVAQALAQAGDRDGALQAAGNIQDEGDKARALSGVAEATAKLDIEKSLNIFLNAVKSARYAGRNIVFQVLENASSSIATVKSREILYEVDLKIMDVESWWV